MTNFSKVADSLKTSGIPFNKTEYDTVYTGVRSSVKLLCQRLGIQDMDVDTLLNNPNEVMLQIGKIWGQEMLKIFFVIADKDIAKIGKTDTTSRQKAELFFYLAKYYKHNLKKAELLYSCLMYHILEYENDKITTAYKKGVLVQSPTISLKYFGFKKNDYLYNDYIAKYTSMTANDENHYYLQVDNINHISLLNSIYGYTPTEARAYLSKQTMGLLENRIPLEVEERLLPFLLSDQAELLFSGYNGVLAEDFHDKMSEVTKGIPTAYAFNSNPYTYLVTTYKIATISTVIAELLRVNGQTKFTFINDTMFAFKLPEGFKVPDDNTLAKYVKPITRLRMFEAL